MTTSQKLKLGFGMLTTLFVLSGVGVLVSLRFIADSVDKQANIARPRSAATRELEINVLGYALAVNEYLQNADPQAKKEAANDTSTINRELGKYQRLARTDQQRELATRFAIMWKEMYDFGQTLLNAENRQLQRKDTESFIYLRRGLEKFLDDEMQTEAIKSYNTYRDATFQNLRDIVIYFFSLFIVGIVIALVTSGVVGRDIVKAEGQLRGSEERYRVLIEVSPQTVWTGRADGYITYFNKHWFDYTGLTMEQSEGNGWTQAIDPNHQQQVLSVLQEVWTKGVDYEVEIPFCRALDGIYRWHLMKGVLTKGEGGQVGKVMGIAIDIHDYRQAKQLEEYRHQLEEANARLETLATTDGLTQLKNRRAFQEKLMEEVNRAGRYSSPLSFLLLDVDHFKQFNDTFGHPAGDGVLRSVARLLEETARKLDFVARYGGEEFAVLLPNTDKEGAVVAAERFRSAVAEGDWRERAITVSVGVATLTTDGGDGSALIQEADAALYQSKRSGRNCVHHAGDLKPAVG